MSACAFLPGLKIWMAFLFFIGSILCLMLLGNFLGLPDNRKNNSTQQPEQHHRVVILQLPPSLDGGLKSQSLIILLYCFFNCLTKALMPQPSYNTGEASSALLFLTSKTFFQFKAGLHHRMSRHQLLPLQ